MAVVDNAAQNLQKEYNQRVNTGAQQINQLYGNQLASQQQQLKTAYDQNLSDQTAAKNQIGKTYQASANDLAVQYERNKRNLNMQAAANGLNTGTGSQQQLALNQQYLTNMGKLRGQEAQANVEADRQIANLKMNYQNQVSQAIADNDFKRAAALMDNYNQQQGWLDAKTERAEDLALRAKERAESREWELADDQRAWQRTQQTRAEDQAIRAAELQKQYDVRAQERAEDLAQRNLERSEDWQHTLQTRKEDLEQRNKERSEDQAIRAAELEKQYEVRAQEREEDFAQRNKERAEDRQWSVEDRDINLKLDQAKTAASYGDFSGYAALYGNDIAKTMKQTWVMQNPDLAWATGQISRTDFQMLTGREPNYYWLRDDSDSGGGNNNNANIGNLGEMWWALPEAHTAWTSTSNKTYQS